MIERFQWMFSFGSPQTVSTQLFGLPGPRSGSSPGEIRADLPAVTAQLCWGADSMEGCAGAPVTSTAPEWDEQH